MSLQIGGQSGSLDISALIQQFKQVLNPDAIAWSFPECAGRVLAEDERYHLGAVLVLRNVGKFEQ